MFCEIAVLPRKLILINLNVEVDLCTRCTDKSPPGHIPSRLLSHPDILPPVFSYIINLSHYLYYNSIHMTIGGTSYHVSALSGV